LIFVRAQQEATKEVAEIHVLPTRSLFGDGIPHRLLLRVSLTKPTSAAFAILMASQKAIGNSPDGQQADFKTSENSSERTPKRADRVAAAGWAARLFGSNVLHSFQPAVAFPDGRCCFGKD